MIAAIYARKSTEQNGREEEQKSVARQVDHARQYAERKGWTVDAASIFVDDGISGAEFTNRPGFLRLMNALKPRAPFQVLVISEESRLGREQIETSYALKQLVQAGVAVWCYLDDRQRTIDSPMEKAMLALQGMSDEMEREKARQRTYDALLRKARAGHVTGGRVFGYANVECLTAAGERSHVERRILDAEAAVIQRIFELATVGKGLRAIAHLLNEAGALTPRAQQGRPRGWAPSSVREALHRELYRGVIVWNQTRKRDAWGLANRTRRAVAERVDVAAPHLRIVSEAAWDAAHARLDGTRRTYLRGTNGQLWGRPANGRESRYLLTGLARCADCGASLVVRSRGHGTRRAYFYACSAFHRCGGSVCSNSLEMRLDVADDAILSALEAQLLDEGIISDALARATARLAAPEADPGAQRAALRQQLEQVTGELARLTDAVLAGGEAATLVQAMRERERHGATLRRALETLERPRTAVVDRAQLQQQMRERLGDWKGLLRAHVPQARQMLRKLLDGRIDFAPDRLERRYRFSIPATLSRFFNGLVDPQMMASPAGLSKLDERRVGGPLRRVA